MKPNPPGRPRLDPSDSSVSVTLRVPSKHYDRMNLEAKRARLTLPDWMRERVKVVSQRSE
jgi:hypothetical protein